MAYANIFAADTSSLIALLKGESGNDVDLITEATGYGRLFIAPIALTEILSDFKLSPALTKAILKIPILEIEPGYWERAGKNRALLLSKKFKAKTADALIAQSCIDHNAPLITRDGDFRHFAKHCGLKLA